MLWEALRQLLGVLLGHNDRRNGDVSGFLKSVVAFEGTPEDPQESHMGTPEDAQEFVWGTTEDPHWSIWAPLRILSGPYRHH